MSDSTSDPALRSDEPLTPDEQRQVVAAVRTFLEEADRHGAFPFKWNVAFVDGGVRVYVDGPRPGAPVHDELRPLWAEMFGGVDGGQPS